MKVNVEYPEAVEIPDVPPQLLLTLPQLPKQLKYRLVGDYMLLVDRENDLIIDYMTNALPPVPPAVKAEVARRSAKKNRRFQQLHLSRRFRRPQRSRPLPRRLQKP